MNQFTVAGRWWAIAGSLVMGLLLASAIRYGVLENEAQARLCEQGDGGWCAVRSGLGWSIYMQIFGLAALVLAAGAWIPALRRLALPGLFLAGCGLFIYNTTFAAVALVVGLLAALRPAGR